MRLSLLRGLLVCAAIAVARAGVAAPLDEPIKPLQSAPKLDPARVEIGRKLFHDPRLSANGKLACAGCHDLAKGGVDNRARAVGFDGQTGGVNTETGTGLLGVEPGVENRLGVDPDRPPVIADRPRAVVHAALG